MINKLQKKIKNKKLSIYNTNTNTISILISNLLIFTLKI